VDQVFLWENFLCIYNEATCLGWVEGFADGFTAHEELLSVPEKERMVCVPHEIITIQTFRVIKKYIADNPEKTHRQLVTLLPWRWRVRS